MFIADVRKHIDLGMDRKSAINRAVEQCIEKGGPLAEIMRAHKAEVTDMLLTEYDEAFHIASEKELAREEERINTERERQRADSAEQRADSAEQRADNAEQRADKFYIEKEVFKLKFQGKEEVEIADALGIHLDEVNQILSEL